MEWERVTIQKMNIQDLDEVLSIETSASLTPWSKNMFIEEMQNPFAHCFVMKTRGRIQTACDRFYLFSECDRGI